MKLKDCTYGKLVCQRANGKVEVVGMIVGITNNCYTGDQSTREDPSRAIPLVKWSCGRETGIHPANIEIFKGE